MALKHFKHKYLHDMSYDHIPGDDTNVGAMNLSIPDNYGSLENCSWSGVGLLDRENAGCVDSLDDVTFAVWDLVHAWYQNPTTGDMEKYVRSRLVFDEDVSPGPTFVITMDERDQDLGKYRCPVCGQDMKGFTAYPPTEFDMDNVGSMTVPLGMAVDPSFDDDGTKCICKECGFESEKGVFNTFYWYEYKGRVE